MWDNPGHDVCGTTPGTMNSGNEIYVVVMTLILRIDLVILLLSYFTCSPACKLQSIFWPSHLNRVTRTL